MHDDDLMMIGWSSVLASHTRTHYFLAAIEFAHSKLAVSHRCWRLASFLGLASDWTTSEYMSEYIYIYISVANERSIANSGFAEELAGVA